MDIPKLVALAQLLLQPKISYPRIIRVSIPESKVWNFLDNFRLYRTHQALPRKDERVIYVTCNTAGDEDLLAKRIASL